MTQIYLIKSRLTSFCMQSVFEILPINLKNGGLDTSQGGTIKLLDHACMLSEELVRASNKLYTENAAAKLHPQNLSWSQDFLLNSCDATLQADLKYRLVTIPDSKQGGPLILHMVLNQLMSTMHEAARAIINHLQQHSITNYPGENINNFCATFNNAVQCLGVSSHIPSDISNIFFLRLGTCTVAKFTGMLDSFEFNDDPIIDNFFNLREKVITKYNTLLLTEKWLPTHKTTSSFSTKQETKSSTLSNTVSETKGKTDQSTADKKPKFQIDTTPPKTGKPNWKENPRDTHRKLWWCSECPNGTPNSKGCWGNHSTNQHDPTKVNRRASSNMATTSSSTETTATTATGTTASLALSSTSIADF